MGTTPTAEIALAPVGTPSNRNNHVIYIRAKKANVTDSGTLQVALYEGATLRGGPYTIQLTDTMTTYALSLTTVEATAIVNYSNLRVRLTGTSVAGLTRANIDSVTMTDANTRTYTPGSTSNPAWSWDAPLLTVGSAGANHWQQAINNGGTQGAPVDPTYIFPVTDGLGGQAIRFKIDPATLGGALQMTALANPAPNSPVGNPTPYMAGGYTWAGADTWYRLKIRFPSGLYHPTGGVFNIHWEWHQEYYGSNTVTKYPSPFLGVHTDGSAPSPTNPRLCFCFRGGINGGTVGAETIQYNFTIDELIDPSLRVDTYPSTTLPANTSNTKPLQYDHWYDVLVHYLWEPTDTGIFELWIDDVKQYSRSNITTMHVYSDGSFYPNGHAIYHYRRADMTNISYVDFMSEDIGPSKESVTGGAPPPPSGTLYVDINPNTNSNLVGWQNIEMGQTGGNSQGFSVSSFPTGITSPAIVRVVNDPLGAQGKVYELTVTPQALANNSTANRVDLYQSNGVAWYDEGEDHWEHFRVMFPGANVYKPTPGNFNWIYQHHNILAGASGTGIVMGLNTSVSGLPANQLFVRVAGGDVNALPAATTQNLGSVTGQGLLTDHWYDMYFYILYSTTNSGRCQWYVDGTLIMDVTRPTMFYNSTTGVRDQPNYEYSNYRLYNSTITWNSTIYYSRHKQGSTKSIVDSL